MSAICNIDDWEKLLSEVNSDNYDIVCEIASYYDYGYEIDGSTIVPQNQKEAIKLYEKASANGHINSIVRLADYYSEGIECKKNIDLAIKLYEKGIEGGNSIAAKNLATIYRDFGDFSKAFELYQIAQSMDEFNIYELAYCYYYGIGTKFDKQKAFEIFKSIADDETENRFFEYQIEDANYFIGLHYLEGIFVEKSIDKARDYFEKANHDNDHRNANELLLMIGRRK
jgi:TPR repeat protein